MTAAPAVELRALSKTFGANVAAADLNLRVEAGTIHGIIGENGAGKSTAMKMLYGLFRPDGGEILIDGMEREWSSPMDAIRAGVGMVHQHFMLAGPYSALDNIVLGAEGVATPLSRIQRQGARQELEKLAERYGLPVPLMTPVEQLPVGVQQRVEILKLLYRKARILILDEPTAVLTPPEATELFANLRKLKAEGKTLLIITHKLKEVMAFTDRVTVFRGGRTTGEFETADADPQRLADAMVGRRVALTVEIPAAAEPAPVREGRPAAPVLEVCGLRLEAESVKAGHKKTPGGSPEDGNWAKPRLCDVSFIIRPGEIVGIAGVEGNGQSELIQALLDPADPARRTAGEIRLHGQSITACTARQIRQQGVGLVPEDRHHQGLLLEADLQENFLLGLQRMAPYSKHGILRRSVIREKATHAMEEYDVRPRDLGSRVGGLSGGNQQKLIIAREFARNPSLLLAAQPTRGVDIGAIEQIHRRILRARSEGAAVLLVSSELDEVLALSDRILVFYEGAIAGEFKRGECDERELGLRMGGAGHGRVKAT